MPIDDFEWEGEIELTEPAAVAASAKKPSVLRRLRRLRESVWLEPALRLLGVAVFLMGLTGLGIIATTYAKPGVKLPETSAKLAAALGTGWLKPTQEQPADHHAPKPTPSASVAKAAPAPETPVTEAPETGSKSPGLTAEGKVILNLASAQELTQLPGVGVKRAQAIVALRTKLKRFKQPTDLLRVKGIGPRGLKRMLPHLVLDAP